MNDFRGVQQSHIYYDSETEKWVLQSLKNPNRTLETVLRLPDNIPVGTYEWKTAAEYALCGKNLGYEASLTLSECFPGKYTCDSGHCAELYQRCNTEINCKDKSDEDKCSFLSWDGIAYEKVALPIDQSGEPIIVYMNATILSLPNIDTIGLKYTVDFYLNLRWADGRLNFQNLNNRTSLNQLTYLERESLWVPTLVFINSLAQFQTITDVSSTGQVVRLGKPLPNEDITLASEC